MLRSSILMLSCESVFCFFNLLTRDSLLDPSFRKDSEQTKQIEELQKQNEDLTEEKERLLEVIERIHSDSGTMWIFPAAFVRLVHLISIIPRSGISKSPAGNTQQAPLPVGMPYIDCSMTKTLLGLMLILCSLMLSLIGRNLTVDDLPFLSIERLWIGGNRFFLLVQMKRNQVFMLQSLRNFVKGEWVGWWNLSYLSFEDNL